MRDRNEHQAPPRPSPRPAPAPEPAGSALTRLGCRISSVVSDLAAHPLAQLAVIAFCVAWFAVGLATDLLTAALSILAITLTQMVLNRQNEREVEAHRRDVAMHAKLDELVHASRRARDEMAGIEELPVETIAELREQLDFTATTAPAQPAADRTAARS